MECSSVVMDNGWNEVLDHVFLICTNSSFELYIHKNCGLICVFLLPLFSGSFVFIFSDEDQHQRTPALTTTIIPSSAILFLS